MQQQYENNRKHHRKSPGQYPNQLKNNRSIVPSSANINVNAQPHHRFKYKRHHQQQQNHHHQSEHKPAETTHPSQQPTPPPPTTPTTINPIYEYSDELNAAAEMDFSERQSRLWEACSRNNMVGTHPPNAWEFFISPGHSLTWCNVFKAASSTWMYYFNILGLRMVFKVSFSKNYCELIVNLFPHSRLQSGLSAAYENVTA